MASDADVSQVLNAIADMGPHSAWKPYPGGYPNEVEAALLDAVFSLRAKYGTATSGPRAVVAKWRSHVRRPLNSLRSFVADVDDAGGPQGFIEIVENTGVAVPRAKDRPTKAQAARGIAGRLVDLGVDSADDVRILDQDAPDDLYRAITAERGVADAGATYFLMLLGIPGVKADVMIQRFIKRALERSVDHQQVKALITSAAGELGVGVIELDHAIWAHERGPERPATRSGATTS